MSAEPQQETLDFGRLYRVTDATRRLYRILNDAAESIGILQCAGACGLDRGDMRRALDRDKGRRVAVEHAMSIAAMGGPDIRRAIGEWFLKPLDLVPADTLPPLTDKERADRCEAALRALGPIGEAARIAALGGKP
jgi:hypothetical protein